MCADSTGGASSIYATAGEAAFTLITHLFTSNFPYPQANQSFKALLNVRHPSWNDNPKIRTLFESCTIVS